MINNINIQHGWVETTIGNISQRITKGSTPTSYGYKYQNNGIKFIKTENINSNGFIFNIKQFISEDANIYLSRSILKENDILFSIAGTIGRVGIVKKMDLPANTNQALAIIRLLNREISLEYLFFYLKSELVQKNALKKIVGVGRANLSLLNVSELNINLPPLNEQRRIAAKIEELFSSLDTGVKALKKAKEQIKIYKQAVLSFAFNGKLTIDKSQLKINDETGLPEDWKWVKVKDIGDIVTGTTPSKNQPEYYDDTYPFYKPTDLDYGYYTVKSNDGLSELGIKQARLLPEKSILVTCIGATIGKTGLIRKAGASNQQINTIIPHKEYFHEFVYYYIISEKFQDLITEHASATTLPILNKTKFAELNFIYTPFKQQLQIVSEIERRFSKAENMEKTIDSSLVKAESLRQSILKKAFEGRLVPQDPNDEPALVLLERIKAEKAELEKKNMKNRKKIND